MRRIFILLDADGERRGFVHDGPPVSATVYGDDLPLSFGPGLDVATLPVRAAALMGESAKDSGSISATLNLDAFDLWALRETVPTQKVKVRAWFAPVDADGWPVDSAGGVAPLAPAFEIFRGVIRSPKFDLRARTLTFTAAPDLRLLDTQFPPAVIDTDRFPTAPAASTSNAVPIIYGWVFGLPLYAVTAGDPVRLLVAGHPIQTTTIAIMRQDAGVETVVAGAAPILYDIDALGGTYAYAEVTLAQYTAGSNLYASNLVGWKAPDGAAIDRLGDVLLHLWHTYGNEAFFDLDRVRAYSARPLLNRYHVGLVFNQQESGSGLLRMLQGRLEGQFPVAFGLVGGRIGWDCTRLPTDAEIPSRVVGTLAYGLDAHDREGPDETSADSIVTRYELHSVTNGAPGGTVGTTVADRTNMGVLRGAVARWGESPMFRLDCPDMTFGDGPRAVLDDLAPAQAKVRDTLAYVGLDGEWNDAPLFGVVLVTDAECGYVAEPCLIISTAPGLDARVTVGLLRLAGV